jgi:hypothetical protein
MPCEGAHHAAPYQLVLPPSKRETGFAWVEAGRRGNPPTRGARRVLGAARSFGHDLWVQEALARQVQNSHPLADLERGAAGWASEGIAATCQGRHASPRPATGKEQVDLTRARDGSTQAHPVSRYTGLQGARPLDESFRLRPRELQTVVDRAASRSQLSGGCAFADRRSEDERHRHGCYDEMAASRHAVEARAETSSLAVTILDVRCEFGRSPSVG